MTALDLLAPQDEKDFLRKGTTIFMIQHPDKTTICNRFQGEKEKTEAKCKINWR